MDLSKEKLEKYRNHGVGELVDAYEQLQKEAADLWDIRIRLEEQVKGPDGYETWKDAAVDERLKRVAAEKQRDELAATVERLREGFYSAVTWEDVRDIFKTPPQVNLNHVKREHFIKGFMSSGGECDGANYRGGNEKVVEWLDTEVQVKYPIEGE